MSGATTASSCEGGTGREQRRPGSLLQPIAFGFEHWSLPPPRCSSVRARHPDNSCPYSYPESLIRPPDVKRSCTSLLWLLKAKKGGNGVLLQDRTLRRFVFVAPIHVATSSAA